MALSRASRFQAASYSRLHNAARDLRAVRLRSEGRVPHLGVQLCFEQPGEAVCSCSHVGNERLQLHRHQQASTNQYLGRVDYALNPKNQFTVVAIYLSSTVANDIPFTGATVPGFGDGSLTHSHLYTFDYVHQFSPTLVNDVAAH